MGQLVGAVIDAHARNAHNTHTSKGTSRGAAPPRAPFIATAGGAVNLAAKAAAAADGGLGGSLGMTAAGAAAAAAAGAAVAAAEAMEAAVSRRGGATAAAAAAPLVMPPRPPPPPELRESTVLSFAAHSDASRPVPAPSEKIGGGGRGVQHCQRVCSNSVRGAREGGTLGGEPLAVGTPMRKTKESEFKAGRERRGTDMARCPRSLALIWCSLMSAWVCHDVMTMISRLVKQNTAFINGSAINKKRSMNDDHRHVHKECFHTYVYLHTG